MSRIDRFPSVHALFGASGLCRVGLGNTFAFGAYFVTPLAIPPILGWTGVWLIAAIAAGLASQLFPASKD